MIAITAEEKKIIHEQYPDVHIVRTMKQDSKRHHPRWEIVNTANINTSIKRQSVMFDQLGDAGMIRFSKQIDNLSVQVLFVDEESEPVLRVTDFRNLGYQYLKYHGEPYFECQNCGITVKSENATGRKQKYCKECAVEIHMKQTVNSVMRQRYKQ